MSRSSSPRGRSSTTFLADRLRTLDGIGNEFDAVRSARESLQMLKDRPQLISSRMSISLDRSSWGALSGIEHLSTPPLAKDARVGFSVLNLTGLPIRYLQIWEDGHRQTVQYLQDGQRGLLNFIASNTLIRENQIVEDAFTSQHGGVSGKKSSHKLTVGHKVSLQIAGYQWLEKVQADTLGVRYADLTSVVGRMNVNSCHSTSALAANALKLVTEVIPHNGGRLLTLSSAFVVKNDTMHTLRLLTSETESVEDLPLHEKPFLIPPGESFNVPLALLYRSALSPVKEKAGEKSDSLRSLGYLRFSPLERQIIVDDLGISSQKIGDARYTEDAVSLLKIVKRTIQLRQEQRDNFSGVTVHDGIFQLSCELTSQSGRSKHSDSDPTSRGHMSSIHGRNASEYDDVSTALAVSRFDNNDKLPAFCYNVDIEASCHQHGPLGEYDGSRVDEGTKKTFFSGHHHRQSPLNSPCTYTIGEAVPCE